jgi:hypothetical protein
VLDNAVVKISLYVFLKNEFRTQLELELYGFLMVHQSLMFPKKKKTPTLFCAKTNPDLLSVAQQQPASS